MVRSVTEPVQGEACHHLAKLSTILSEKSVACRNIIFLFFYAFTRIFLAKFLKISNLGKIFRELFAERPQIR